ncbi:MAG: hypothetical protein CL768_01140 [Chloroflexi bacterium]|nr:hypothetical protein [Chloroflexota bacterium]
MCINFSFSKYFFVTITAIGSLVILGCFSSVVIIEEDKRIQELNKVLMCPVCPGESIDQSQNELSSQMRAIVEEKVREGWTDKQIKDYFVQRYGPRVVMNPPFSGFSIIAWIIPPFILVSSAILFVFYIRSKLRVE